MARKWRSNTFWIPCICTFMENIFDKGDAEKQTLDLEDAFGDLSGLFLGVWLPLLASWVPFENATHDTLTPEYRVRLPVPGDRAHAKSSSPRWVPHQIDLLSVCNKSSSFLRSSSPSQIVCIDIFMV